MLVKEEYKPSGCTRSFDDTFWWYADTGYWNYTTNIPILEYVRGKIILLRRFKVEGAGIDVSQWPDNATFEQTNSDGVTYHVQDEYKVPTVGHRENKWNKIKNTLYVANIESAPNKIFLNYTSGVSAGAYPYTVADYINPRLVDYIKYITPESYSRGYGIIPMDFPHQDLINRLINLNFYI